MKYEPTQFQCHICGTLLYHDSIFSHICPPVFKLPPLPVLDFFNPRYEIDELKNTVFKLIKKIEELENKINEM